VIARPVNSLLNALAIKRCARGQFHIKDRREVFRIERVNGGALPLTRDDPTHAALPHEEVMAELRELRALLKPQAAVQQESDSYRTQVNGPGSRTIRATPRNRTSTLCFLEPLQPGRRIVARQVSAISAKAATSASANESEPRSIAIASTSGAAACIASDGAAMRPISRP
jgi:hypothetical protein